MLSVITEGASANKGPPRKEEDMTRVCIHSLRLPGYTIGVEVRFGREDERLTLHYDGGPGAGPYVAGTLLAIRRVGGLTGVVRGLDKVL